MTHDDVSDLRALSAAQSGVLHRHQALRHLTARMVERRPSSGRWQSAHHSVYVTHSGPIDHRTRRWIAVLGTGGFLGGLAALESHGFRGFSTSRIDILVPAGQSPRNPPVNVVIHRTTIMPETDLHRAGRPPGTMPARSLDRRGAVGVL